MVLKISRLLAQINSFLQIPIPSWCKKIIYNIRRKFTKDCQLQKYLAFHEPDMISMEKQEYTLGHVLQTLKTIINKKKMFDITNPSCLLFDSNLSRALNTPYAHICQMKDAVASHMELLEDIPILDPSEIAKPPPINFENKFDIDGLYLVTPQMLEVLRTVPGCNPKAIAFQYKEITKMVFAFIMLNKKKMFNGKNVAICNCAGTILGDCFQVNIFHRTQITSLIRAQLRPVSQISGMLLRSGHEKN